ncbi:MAG: transcriptional regulator [Desulfobacterales bacterium]|nr:transcriptional regulator [Desulfobacterales bacterium]
MARGDQLSRQWKIIQRLFAATRGVSVSDLSNDLACHSRTVYRDLEALQLAGFPLYNERVDSKHLWSILDTVKRQPPLPLNLTELMALYFSRHVLKTLKNTPFDSALDTLFGKIVTTIPEKTRIYLDGFEETFTVGQAPYGHQKEVAQWIDILNRAILDRRLVEMDYHTISRDDDTRRRVAPYKIWFFKGFIYLVGHCQLRREVRIFTLDRIKRLVTTEEEFDIPADFSVEDFMSTGFGVFVGHPEKVTILFQPEIAGYIQEKTWHASQRLTPRADGCLEFEVVVAVTAELKNWIMGWGAAATVLSPLALAGSICAEARNLADNYPDCT